MFLVSEETKWRRKWEVGSASEPVMDGVALALPSNSSAQELV